MELGSELSNGNTYYVGKMDDDDSVNTSVQKNKNRFWECRASKRNWSKMFDSLCSQQARRARRAGV